MPIGANAGSLTVCWYRDLCAGFPLGAAGAFAQIPFNARLIRAFFAHRYMIGSCSRE